ncbi:MAG: hypothetical protein N3A54_07185, partial [Patescibacteria group bacterium]|nr:hypothetical protein [Patescibacteria group bacterium]
MQRIWIIFFMLCLLYGGIVARLFYWQIIHGNELKNQALAQYAKRVTLQSNRGAILFSDGSPFVLNQPSYHVYADPYHIPDKRYFAS